MARLTSKRYLATFRAKGLSQKELETIEKTRLEFQQALVVFSYSVEDGLVEELFHDLLAVKLTVGKAQSIIRSLLNQQVSNAIANNAKRDSLPYAFKFEIK